MSLFKHIFSSGYSRLIASVGIIAIVIVIGIEVFLVGALILFAL